MARLNQEREALLQPQRMQGCKAKLEKLGFQVTEVDPTMLEFEWLGATIKFWPYSGWHTGKTIKDGRGFANLLKQIS